ncbi:MAG: hypothetical protein QOJ96_260 [Alphaproteobacteria bacterium]|jgi:SOS response regulatory protein OraA/RecX|nr:hypothetical protein [Alphaproteobacteria bacterium]
MYFDELRPRTTKAAEYWNSAALPDESIIAESFDEAVSLLPAKSSSEHELQEKLRKIARPSSDTCPANQLASCSSRELRRSSDVSEASTT